MTKLKQSLMILISTGAMILIFGFLYYDSIKEANDISEDVVEMDNDTLVEESEEVSEDDSSTFKSAFAPPPTEKKLYDPIISMTDYEVIEDSTWGKPEKINRTETANGVREQWVYPNNKYLYFEDGYLVSIQTSN